MGMLTIERYSSENNIYAIFTYCRFVLFTYKLLRHLHPAARSLTPFFNSFIRAMFPSQVHQQKSKVSRIFFVSAIIPAFYSVLKYRAVICRKRRYQTCAPLTLFQWL